MTTDKDSIFSWRGWYLLAGIAIAVYFTTAFQLADNTPKYDDLNDVFGFFKELTQASTFWQSCAAFFYPNNEHITATNHLIYWLQYQLLGTMDFRALMLTGHVIIAMTGVLLALCVDGNRRPFFFLAFTLAYINLYSWDSSFKAMTALSNQSVIFFTVAAILVLQRYRSIGFGIGLAMLASFSQGNGMLVWPVGLLLLANESNCSSKRKYALLLWCCSGVAATLLYIWAKLLFKLPGPSLTLPYLSGLLQQAPLVPLTASLAFLGSTGLAKTASTMAIIIGTLSCTMIVIAHSRNRLAQPTLFYLAVFIILSAITASGLRGLIAGSADVMLESRYKMYSLAFIMIACVFAAEYSSGTMARRMILITALLVATTLHLDSYREIPAIKRQAENFHTSYDYWLVDGDFKNQTVYFAPLSDYFLFIGHYLSLFDFWQLAPSGQVLKTAPKLLETAECPTAVTEPANCDFTIHHRGNAIATQVNANFANDSTGNRLWLCNTQSGQALQFALPDTRTGHVRWLIPEQLIPAGQYLAWINSKGTGTCAASAIQPNSSPGMLIKKPRKVDEQMHELFNGATTVTGE